MIFQSPLLLGALALLPAIWWLLRARPPAPRTQVFPPVALLARLRPEQNDAATPPLWLLLLRLLAVALLIIAFAGPVLPGQPVPLAGSGNLLLVLDDDVMAAAGWDDRARAAHAVLDAAGRAGRQVILLRTARRNPAGADEEKGLPSPVSAARAAALLDATRPAPWAADRKEAARRLSEGTRSGVHTGAVLYLSNGIASSGADGAAADTAFTQALRSFGPVQDVRFHTAEPVVLSPSHTADATAPDTTGIMARLETLPVDAPRAIRIRAHSQDGGTLALSDVTIPAGQTAVTVPVSLPPAMRNRVDMLTVDGYQSAAATLLSDEGDRIRPVGLISAGTSDTPLVGSLFYLRRALTPSSDLHQGTAASLLSQPLSVLIAPDGTIADPDTRHRIADWVRKGGTLIRFAGRTLTAHEDGTDDSTPAPDAAETHSVADTLLPVTLMPAARQLGGTMSWGKPQPIAPFPEDSPFHGLTVPQDVSVSRQVLARPVADLNAHTWVRLADGTPLVTHASLGKGEVILFHVTPTADWSTLPLSGLFVSMLERLSEHAAGVTVPGDQTILSPVLTLDGDGVPGAPPPFARGLPAGQIGKVAPSPEHPPGLYGSRADRRALNVGDTLHQLTTLAATGTVSDPAGHRPDRKPGPFLLAVALGLLLLDGLIALLSAGLLRRPRHAAGAVLIAGLALSGALPAHAQEAPASPPVPGAALETRLAYVLTGNEETDAVSREGLQGLSDYVNARTSAVLGHPDGVRPGSDDLSFYPLLYWPVTPDAHTTPAMTAALSSFMARGGILLIDTQGTDPSSSRAADTGDAALAEENPGSAAALRRITSGLPIPALTKLTDHHVLAHTFYLMHAFPGRYAGLPVWVAREGEAENDDVSPVIIGSSDWAHAWATDENGDTRFAVVPGGDDQRRTAYRFGVNAVIYALTGNYKGDQLHVPAILRRLGE